ncbi:MAG: AMP-binding protein [Proteobacteria bacterium]|nr:AMP-binding protein [Burkholderiales bacterium]
MVDHWARETPQAPYLIAPETGAVMTYDALHGHCRELARVLLMNGLEPGDKVSLMMHNGYQTARLLLGVMYAGMTVQPINLLAQASQLKYVLDHSDTRLVFAAHEYVERLRAPLEEITASGAREIAVFPLNPDQIDIFDDPYIAHLPLPPVAPDDEALLMYTSGTTGVPKGVVQTHHAVSAGGRFTTAAHALTQADRVLCTMPLYHINGQIVTTVAPLAHGGSVVMPHRFSASAFWQLVADHRCTWINVVPTIIAYLLNGPDPRALGLDLSRVRFCRSASAPLSPHHHRAFEAKFGIGVIETMGLTETNAPAFTNPLDPGKRKLGSPGQAFGNTAKVIDAEGRTVAAGVAGEIMIRGDNVMKGYYKSPEQTAQAFDRDGWLHTGDLGYLDDDGFVFVTGRLKELIIKGGENIAPREIDEALLRHPAVLEAAAVGIPDARYGQQILACVIARPGAIVTAEELIAFCVSELGPYKTPALIRLVDDLPKGPSGKVQRLKLAEMHNPG